MTATARSAPGHAEVLQAIDALTRDAPTAIGLNDERKLRRYMQSFVGLPLRTLGGILRFQRARVLMRDHPELPLVVVASAAGYADQAHMTRAFRRFAGFTPKRPQAAPWIQVLV